MTNFPTGTSDDYKIVDGRAVGKDVPFSIGIAIPLTTELIKEKIVYNAVFMNFRTLFRAFHGSYSQGEMPNKVKLIEAFTEELTNLKAYVEALGYIVNIYHCNYPKLTKKFPDAQPKKPESPKERIYADYEHTAFEVSNELGLIDQITSYRINGVVGKAVMITHYPIDLLSQYNFGELFLLESHSGNLKDRTRWNSKLGIKSDITPRIPFNILTLQLFGDGAKMFKSVKELKLKKAFIQLVKDNNWTTYTTMSRIRATLNGKPKNLEKDQVDRLIRMLSIKY